MNSKQPEKIRLKQGEMLSTTTIRIEGVDINGNSSSGTGFYYSIDEGAYYFPMIITNKHVLKDMQEVRLVFTKSDSIGNRINEHFKFTINDVSTAIVGHPDDKIDLCALSLYPIIADLRASGIEIHTYYINSAIIPGLKDLEKLDAIEEILMIGYPNGLWDKINNMPLVRRGITSTNPKLNYNGNDEFLIDAACFPGSSGSPVFYLDRTYKTEIQENVMGHKIYLLGILYSGPLQEIIGQVIDPNVLINTYSQTTINLGNVIKSYKLIELEAQVKKQFQAFLKE
ncbi:MAG TPA: serine protease [Ferruginibacter sp.]|nr:serine protease [Ferruginibacter sp.]